ncbi:MAG: LamG domain-containing protein, partial [Phycisphaeraceae bacterium]|nr:LamG domain-containing protein [Phycisphaeraceae bacterium]
GNTGTLYVQINNTKVTYAGDPENLTLGVWQAWNIDLSSMNVQNVTKLQIGVDGGSAAGMILIDDIKLYGGGGEVITPVDPGTANLAGAWSLDEGNGTSTSDASGNGLTGTIVGALWDQGPQGSALLFAEMDYVETAYAGITGTGPRTYTAWIKTVEADRTIMSCGLNTTGNKWRIRLDATGGLRVEVNGGYNYGQAFLADDEWHHTAVVLDDDGTPDVDETLLYVDGLPETTRAIQSTAIDTDATGEFRIGLATYDTVGFIGSIDDVRVYDRALSDGEVRSLAGKTTPVDKPF